MSLTATDLQEIRTVVKDEVRSIFESDGRLVIRSEVSAQLEEKLKPLADKLEALGNDVK
jgi:hypothetical protein